MIDLVGMAEAPLYSTYRWVGKHLGRDVPLAEFLDGVDEALRRRSLRLWITDPRGSRIELTGVPSGLEMRYRDERALDETFDPFGFSLTLGPNADTTRDTEWSWDVDLRGGTFVIRLRPGDEQAVLERLRGLYPSLRLTITSREDEAGMQRIAGTITDEAAT